MDSSNFEESRTSWTVQIKACLFVYHRVWSLLIRKIWNAYFGSPPKKTVTFNFYNLEAKWSFKIVQVKYQTFNGLLSWFIRFLKLYHFMKWQLFKEPTHLGTSVLYSHYFSFIEQRNKFVDRLLHSSYGVKTWGEVLLPLWNVWYM